MMSNAESLELIWCLLVTSSFPLNRVRNVFFVEAIDKWVHRVSPKLNLFHFRIACNQGKGLDVVLEEMFENRHLYSLRMVELPKRRPQEQHRVRHREPVELFLDTKLQQSFSQKVLLSRREGVNELQIRHGWWR